MTFNNHTGMEEDIVPPEHAPSRSRSSSFYLLIAGTMFLVALLALAY